MLSEPNADDPLDHDLARLYKRDKKKYETKVKEHTRKHAIQNYGRYSLISNYRQPSKVYTSVGLCRRVKRNCVWRKSRMVDTGIESLSVPTRIKNFFSSIPMGFLNKHRLNLLTNNELLVRNTFYEYIMNEKQSQSS